MQNKLDAFTRIVVVLSLLALVLSLLPVIGYAIKLTKEPKIPSSVIIELEELRKEKLKKEQVFRQRPRMRKYFK